MEIRKESLSALKLCRFCLTQDDTLTSLYESNRAPKNSVTLQLKILSSVSVEVFPSDKMLTFICGQCKFFMGMTYEYKQICRQADENILQYIQHGTPLASVPWPPSLKNILHSDGKPSQVGVMKVADGGATIQVTAQESDSDEDDDENSYDIKIGDMSDDGSKNAHVNIIASPKKQARNPKKGKDWVDTESAVDEGGDGARGQAVAGGCWPCDECDRTYPLQQLLELHKQQKHRVRKVQCSKCNAKFFSNSDLITHQMLHTDETSFQCAACKMSFKRLIRLKRHEKMIHSDIPQLPCPNCPATFLSLEELQDHQKRHTHYAERRYICPICDRRFFERGTLQRHRQAMHDRKAKFSCQYCPQRFTTVSKLTRHVREHAGERAYPCKYCDKSFMKSHHYTRHLRLKHQGTVSTRRGPFGENEQFRCEQCEDSFTTQDELIYHSAIHATQNLTCPLCQEKFHDVDAVTAHIKSHVNGMEFMCDMCELVFTSKQKLYNHMAIAHEDEMRNSEDLAQDESSMEMDAEDDEDDNTINLKEEDDHMVVEIKQPGEFLITDLPHVEAEEKNDNTISEESETDATYADFATADTPAIAKIDTVKPAPAPVTAPAKISQDKPNEKSDVQTASIIRKAEEIKRKVGKQQTPESSTDKKEKSINKPEANTAGASDKSLRLLEKELQELKRTNTRNEGVKTPSKPVETLRNRRPQLHTSTPKLRSAEEKKTQPSNKPPAPEKKVAERRVITKENKEPKETKEPKANASNKEDKEVKEKEMPKGVVKNGTSDKSGSEEGIRRSTRPSKIKDYAKMIRDRSQDTEEDDEEDSDDSDEYKEDDPSEVRPKQRRSSIKPVPKVAQATPATPARKRGRPRKDAAVPSKMKKDNDEDDAKAANTESDNESTAQDSATTDSDNKKATPASVKLDTNKPIEQNLPAGGIIVSPTGQTLKKIPIKALPPGVKPMPLPLNARPVGTGEVCEMQIGKKMVKVQKIVMTKAEVEAMAKKGLVEMKDGTMVLKQGIKLATGLNNRPIGVGDESTKESPTKKATPTRCELGDA